MLQSGTIQAKRSSKGESFRSMHRGFLTLSSFAENSESSDKIIFDGREKTMITSLQMSFSVRDARPQFCRPSTTFRLARYERSSTALVDTL